MPTEADAPAVPETYHDLAALNRLIATAIAELT